MNGINYVRKTAGKVSPQKQQTISSAELAATHTRSTVREIRVSSKKSLDVQKCCVCAEKRIVAMILVAMSKKDLLSTKKFTETTLEDCGNRLMRNYRRTLEVQFNVLTTNKGFRTIKHSVAKFEQTKKGLSFFIWKEL